MKITQKMVLGRVRPAKGPYPKGVVNGPQPQTERGWRRRKNNTDTFPNKETNF